jgi:hypothetical protein
MYSNLTYYKTSYGINSLCLPFDLDAMLSGWARVQSIMPKEMPSIFTRDEWAYLIMFLNARNLRSLFTRSFGDICRFPENGKVASLFRPKGRIALWLPNNVTLLGPILVAMLSLTGNMVRIKVASHSQNLVENFFDFVITKGKPDRFKDILKANFTIECFDKNSPMNSVMAKDSDVRIIFGTDESAESINSLPHPLESFAFNFVDRQSEAWLEKDAISMEKLETIVKVFAIYGQAGCTSPRRLVMLDSGIKDAMEIRDGLVSIWPKIIKKDVPAHMASNSVMISQWAAALGYDAKLTERNGAVLTVGPKNMPVFDGLMSLQIVTSTINEARTNLPSNIQTVGYVLKEPINVKWLEIVSGTKIKRFVPLEHMHNFGPVWDCHNFWKQTFEEVDVHY